MKKVISLSITALAGLTSCSNEDTAAAHCRTPSFDTTTLDSNSHKTDTGKPLEDPSLTTSLILQHAEKCYSAFRDSNSWCQNVMDYNRSGEADFCNTNFANEPTYLQNICHQKAANCLNLWTQFASCLDSLPADASCKTKLKPFSNSHDTDGDGLSDHFELWHSKTDPCEPCSQGNLGPCDADADSDGDGTNNKDAQKFSGGCISYIPTDECG